MPSPVGWEYRFIIAHNVELDEIKSGLSTNPVNQIITSPVDFQMGSITFLLTVRITESIMYFLILPTSNLVGQIRRIDRFDKNPDL